MKIKFTFLLTLSTCFITGLFAQIPNGDFEQWTDFGDWEDPDSWFTLNSTYNGDPETVQATGDAITGDMAVQLENEKDDNDNVVRAMMVSGGNSPDNHPGFPYANRPAALIGYFQYKPKDEDSCCVLAYLTRYNTSAQQRELKGLAEFSSGEETDDYDIFSAPFQYVSSLFPDTAYIVIYAGAMNDHQDGSRLVIDALSFDESSTGITSLEDLIQPELFPNPAKEMITVQFNSNGSNYDLKLFDLSGRTLKVIPGLQNQASSSIKDLNDGIYFFTVGDEKRNRTNGKLIINKK